MTVPDRWEPRATDMSEGGMGGAAPYTDAARARLVMAYDACVLADLARAAVPIGEHELNTDGTTRSPGAVLADAARVLAAARRFFETAAVFERVAGADWQLVGDVLGVPPQAARARFAVAETGFREELLPGGTGPTEAGETSRLRAHMVGEPLETALDLDDWVLRHQDGDDALGPTPVSGGLTWTDPPRHAEKHP
ncbi:hypothetical protein [Streptomyces sp. HYC2]|uniref:hypothetical protein n=1 Tax=Streptomyces sp. HYC2 TaxID=2955207 RepID=UPI0024800709|nr:hypothetical protein [Streptomyces sp. HYC2]